MNHLKVLELNSAINSLNEAIKYVKSFDVETIQEIIDSYYKDLNEYNKQTLSVVNVTKSELGRVRSAYKSFVSSFYISELKREAIESLTPASQNPDYIGENCNIEDWKQYKDCYADWEYPKGSDIYDKEYSNKIESINHLERELRSVCFEELIPKDVLNSKILLGRRGFYNRGELERSLNGVLRLEMLKHYQETNKEFINQKLEDYETSKC